MMPSNRKTAVPAGSTGRPTMTLAARILPFLFLWLACVVSTPALYEIELQPGWNLISLPEQQLDLRIAKVTVSIEGLYDSIWSCENGAWHVYYPDEPELSDLVEMDAGKAYWIYMKVPGVLAGAGLKPASTLLLNTGWNHIGFNGAAAMPLAGWIQAAGGQVLSVWSMQNGQWQSWSAADPDGSSLQTVQPGLGYQVECAAPAMLTAGLVIPSTVKVLDEESIAKLTSVTAAKIVFNGSTPLLVGLNQGDILVSNPVPLAPAGLFCKIDAIRRPGTRHEITPGAACAGDAITNGAASALLPVNAETLSKASLPAGNKSMAPVRDAVDSLPGSLAEIQIDREVVVSQGKTIHFYGSIKLDSRLIVHQVMQTGQLAEFACLLTGRVETQIKALASGKFTVDSQEWDLLPEPVRLPPVCLLAGPVPLWIFPQLSIQAGVSGDVNGTLTQQFGSSAIGESGIRYNPVSGWTAVRNLDCQFSNEPFTQDLNLSAKIWAGPSFSLQVYGQAGTSLRQSLTGEFGTGEPPSPFAAVLGNEIQLAAPSTGFLRMIGAAWSYEMPAETVALCQVYPGGEGTITGQVRDLYGNLEGVRVAAGGGNPGAALTGPDGRFTLTLPAGFYSYLEFTKEGYQTVQYHEVKVGAGTVQNLPAVTLMQPGADGSFTGTVRDVRDNQGVPGLMLHFRSGINALRGGLAAVATTGANGEYQVENIPPGLYTGEIASPEYLPGRFPARCFAGQTASGQDGLASPSCRPPVITLPPAHQSIDELTPVTLTVSVAGTEPLHYRWYEGESGDTTKIAAGSTDSPSYTSPPLKKDARYWVQITNHCGQSASQAAGVTVISGGKPGIVLETDPIVGNMRYVLAGTYQQGRGANDPCRYSDESPFFHHLSKNLAVMETEVTFTMWEDVASHAWLPTIHPEVADKELPLNRVTWREAVLFANTLSYANLFTPCYYSDSDLTLPIRPDTYKNSPIYCKWDADGYRLPTEGEWEYFCRAGTTSLFSIDEPLFLKCQDYCGKNDLPALNRVAWFCAGSQLDGPVVSGQKEGNPWNLQEVHGNVMEWCWDYYGTYPVGQVTDYRGNPNGTERVLRGGSWSSGASALRSARRFRADPAQRNDTIGFRLVRQADYSITAPPKIIRHPANQSIVSNEKASLSVRVTGTGPIHYAWFQMNGNTSVPAPGASDSSVYLTPSLTAPATYWVLVSNENGEQRSLPAVVTVGNGSSPGIVYSTDPIVGRMRYVPSGSFTQGHPWAVNLFVHRLTNGLAVMETELTQKMWAELAALQWLPEELNHHKGNNLPVESVSFPEAVLFANQLSLQNGLTRCYYLDGAFRVPVTKDNINTGFVYCDWEANGYRLPSEGEWEYFCRAGTTSTFSVIEPTGDNHLHSCQAGLLKGLERAAWFCANSGGATHPAGVKIGNYWNLKDVHGNVSEMCWDFSALNPKGTVTDYHGPFWEEDLIRVAKGGAFDLEPLDCASGCSQSYGVYYYQRSMNIGFRLVRRVLSPIAAGREIPITISPEPAEADLTTAGTTVSSR